MKRRWIATEYTTTVEGSDPEGWTAVHLHRLEKGVTVLAAKVVFWDADGHYYISILVDEVPLEIIEELIAEARAEIKVK
jgi:hypothetical protein